MPQSSIENDSLFDAEFWNEKWLNHDTKWDIGYASPAIVDYFKKLNDKSISILIPGCGNAYEAEELLKMGFSNITLIDIASTAAQALEKRFKQHPQITVICADFFQHDNKYDVILEQTFFCALHPSLRQKYANHMAELLKPNGILIGLLFNRSFDAPYPPFGGSIPEYRQLFSPHFNIETLEVCNTSIPPRRDSEAFIVLRNQK